MDVTQILQKTPFALMFFFPVWAVVFAFVVAFKRHSEGNESDETESRAITAAGMPAGISSSGSELTRERKIELLHVFAINPLLFAPAGNLQETARRLLDDLSVPGMATAVSPVLEHSTDHAVSSGPASQYHVATQATVALLISIAAVIWHLLSH
jgi:hypothetical protein